MLFVGQFRHALDAKSRLFIPAKYRSDLGTSFYVTRKTEACLAIYPEESWIKLTDKLNGLPDSVVGPIKQFLYSKTVLATPDSQGRIILPPELLDYAHIEKNIVIIGVGDHLQIWSEPLWEEKDQSLSGEALRDRLVEIGL